MKAVTCMLIQLVINAANEVVFFPLRFLSQESIAFLKK